MKMLPKVAELFIATLTSTPPAELETCLVAALRRDFFLLGDPAKHATMSFFHKFVQQRPNEANFESFLNDLWEIHQVEDSEALPMSDVVERFIRKCNTS